MGINISGMGMESQGYTVGVSNKKSVVAFENQINQSETKKYKSVVAEFKKKNPGNTHVDEQVRAGKNYIARCGATNISRSEMTMEEYKAFFTSLRAKIPYDISQNDTIETWSMTEEGWEQMKNDPDYEAWVLGYTIEDRSVHFPFQAKHVNFEKFGASIEEHSGQGFNVYPEDGTTKKEDSLWNKRKASLYAKKVTKRQEEKKRLEEEIWKRAQERKLAIEEYLDSCYENKRMMQRNFSMNTQDQPSDIGMVSTMNMGAMATAAYEQNSIILPTDLI